MLVTLSFGVLFCCLHTIANHNYIATEIRTSLEGYIIIMVLVGCMALGRDSFPLPLDLCGRVIA